LDGWVINYRTTDEIRRFAVRLLEGRSIDDLDGGQDMICVVARTKRLVDSYVTHLEAAGFKTYKVRADAAEQRDRPGVRVATMHRVKGLEFDHVKRSARRRGVVRQRAG
jgi:superfamily I DNA/RNA helicase